MARRLARLVACALVFVPVSPQAWGANVAKEAAKLAKELATDKSPAGRASSARLLGHKGPAAASAAPALVAALADTEAVVRAAAAEALGMVVPGGAQAELLALARTDQDDTVFAAAAASLKDEGLAELLKAGLPEPR